MENPKKSGIPTKYVQENPWNTSEGLGAVGQAKVESLKELINEVEEMIKERNKLSGSFIKEGEKMKTKIHNFILENAPKGEDDSEFTRERAELRKKQIDISELQLNERVGCWRDIALLKKELRENSMELTEKESRTEMIGNILKD
jgi:hypothetical protein